MMAISRVYAPAELVAVNTIECCPPDTVPVISPVILLHDNPTVDIASSLASFADHVKLPPDASGVIKTDDDAATHTGRIAATIGDEITRRTFWPPAMLENIMTVESLKRVEDNPHCR